jgi:hypothetical protein
MLFDPRFKGAHHLLFTVEDCRHRSGQPLAQPIRGDFDDRGFRTLDGKSGNKFDGVGIKRRFCLFGQSRILSGQGKIDQAVSAWSSSSRSRDAGRGAGNMST